MQTFRNVNFEIKPQQTTRKKKTIWNWRLKLYFSFIETEENEKKSITRMCAATPEAAKATCEARFKNDNEICETCDSDGWLVNSG